MYALLEYIQGWIPVWPGGPWPSLQMMQDLSLLIEKIICITENRSGHGQTSFH